MFGMKSYAGHLEPSDVRDSGFSFHAIASSLTCEKEKTFVRSPLVDTIGCYYYSIELGLSLFDWAHSAFRGWIKVATK